ncbi:MAG TPA: hypothetical protein VFD56_12150 [Chitinophagaceae bacterium]|nr:hypothetical protein [Chitinophagaceae bacterium]
MKKIFMIVGTALIITGLNAQLKTTTVCPSLSVDLLDGKVNDLKITDNNTQIKAKLPCFTSEAAEATSSKCGGGVFYKDRDIFFYTGRDYVEIGPKFKGKLSLPLMGASRTSLFKWLGHPKIKDVNWDAFTTAYGIMILYYTKANKVNKIQCSTKTAESINLCE